MDKQLKNVYSNQPQSVNHNVMNPLHLSQAQASSPPMHPYAAQPHFYVPHQQFMMHSQPNYPYNIPSQQFMMGPPPPYSNTAPPAYSIAPPHMYPAAMPPGYSVPIQTQPPRTAVFDAGARFNNNLKGPVNIPPPPPGYLPNAAQIASMQGQSVLLEKKTNNFFTGGKGAGYTFW